MQVAFSSGDALFHLNDYTNVRLNTENAIYRNGIF